jgi:hypothetical protein
LSQVLTQNAVDAVVDDIARPHYVVGSHRKSTSERFQDDKPEGVRP